MFTVFSQYLFKTLESVNQTFVIAFTITHHTQFPEPSGLDRVFVCWGRVMTMVTPECNYEQ
jgi:hypothetical protein